MGRFDEMESIGQQQPAPEGKKPESPQEQPSNRATKQPRLQATTADDSIEVIRKAVKQVGKETTSYRLHETEKAALDDILYALKKQDLKSNENELMRIAINYLITDYQDNKKESIFVRVLTSLRA